MEMRKRFEWAVPATAILLAVGLLLYFTRISPVIYETNDDLFLKWIASGEMTGDPEAKMYYIGLPAGIILSSLYKLAPDLPWYGLYQLAAIAAVMAVISGGILSLVEKPLLRLLSLAAFGLGAYGFFFYHVAELQFTFTTAFLGAGAVFAYGVSILSAENKKTHRLWSILFWLMTFWSISIRLKAFLMLTPILAVLGVGGLFFSKDPADSEARKSARKRILITSFVGCGLLVAVYLQDLAVYGTGEWKEFRDYKNAEEMVTDYYHYPDYDTYRELYDRYDIGPAAYTAASSHYLVELQPWINASSMADVAATAKANYRSLSFGEFIRAFWDRHMISYMDRPLNILVYALYLFVTLWIMGLRRWGELKELAVLVMARTVIWSYLIYMERLPVRVSHGVYAAELACLLVILLKVQKKAGRKASAVMGILAAAMVMALTVRFGFPKAAAAGYDARSKCENGKIFAEVRGYFAEHPHQVFLLDVHSFEYYTENALVGRVDETDNWLFLGSWMAESPWYDKKYDRLGIEDPDNCFFTDPDVKAVFLKVSGDEYEYFEDFCRERYPEKQVYVEDIIHTSAGLEFAVLGCE